MSIEQPQPAQSWLRTAANGLVQSVRRLLGREVTEPAAWWAAPSHFVLALLIAETVEKISTLSWWARSILNGWSDGLEWVRAAILSVFTWIGISLAQPAIDRIPIIAVGLFVLLLGCLRLIFQKRSTAVAATGWWSTRRIIGIVLSAMVFLAIDNIEYENGLSKVRQQEADLFDTHRKNCLNPSRERPDDATCKQMWDAALQFGKDHAASSENMTATSSLVSEFLFYAIWLAICVVFPFDLVFASVAAGLFLALGLIDISWLLPH